MLRVSVIPQKPASRPATPVRAGATVGLYLVISTCLSAVFPNPPIQSSELVNPLSQHALRTARELGPRFENSGLAVNFLSNERSLEADENIAFKSSGTAHLLAISGGQVSFLAPIFSAIMLKPLIAAAVWRVSPLALMRVARMLKSAVELITAACCAAAFGSTGSLLRTVVGKVGYTFPFLRRASHSIFPQSTFASHMPLFRIVLLSMLVPVLGNPLQDLSFLFSSLGATVFALSARQATRLFDRRTLVGAIALALATTALTSGSISLILVPISSGSPLDAMLANIVAIPLVTTWICPASLAILLVPVAAVKFFLIPVLDTGLSILLACASAFSSPAATNALPFFTAKRYLLLCLAFLWTWEDFSFRKRIA